MICGNGIVLHGRSGMNDLTFYSGKKVLITGHTGFKGTWLSKILLMAGAEVTGYSLAPSQVKCFYHETGVASDLHSVYADICDLEQLKQTVCESDCEIVFHMAAQPLVRRSYREPAETFRTNVMGTVNILDACRASETVRSIVNVTTDKVYENREWYWGYREDEHLCGYDPYSNSKSCSELVTSSYRNCFFNRLDSASVSTARSGNVIGGGDYSEDRIIPDCVRAAKAAEPIRIRNPDSTRPYQHVLECLAGYLLLAQKQHKNRSISGAYNFGPDERSCVTTGELVSLFCESWKGAIWEVKGESSGPHEANFLKLDCSKSKRILGWSPKWDIRTAVEKSVEIYNYEDRKAKIDCMEDQIRTYFSH